MTCVLLRLLTCYSVFVTFDTSASDVIDSLTTNFAFLTYTFCRTVRGFLLSLLQLVCFSFIESESIKKCMLFRPGIYFFLCSCYVVVSFLSWNKIYDSHVKPNVYKKFLHAQFHIKELGLLTYFLGIIVL